MEVNGSRIMNSSGRCVEQQKRVVCGRLVTCLGPSPSSCTTEATVYVDGLSLCHPPLTIPSTSPASQATLWTEASVFFLSDGKSGTTRGRDHPHFQSLAETETKASIDPYNPKENKQQTKYSLSIMVNFLPSSRLLDCHVSCLPVRHIRFPSIKPLMSLSLTLSSFFRLETGQVL